MIFLIEYDRSQGQLVKMRAFDDAQSQLAERTRLELEQEQALKGVNHELVLLEAQTEQALRRTHQRYFRSLGQLLHDAKEMPIAPAMS